MSNLIDMVGRLHAYREGHAVRAATHLQITIQPHALIVCPLAMAGEDTAVHALAVGKIGEAPKIKIIADPRVRDKQYELIEWFGNIIEEYYTERRQLGEFPQIWVSSRAAASHLDILADRLRFTRDAPKIKRAGELLTYVTERQPVAGQQALLTATGALGAHFCTGQQEGEDEHLGTFLIWLNPPPNIDIRHAVSLAEKEVMGVKTNPEFDRDYLQPMLAAYHSAAERGASKTEMQEREKAIHEKLAPLAERIYSGVQQALGYLQNQFPPAPMLTELVTRESLEFKSFMESRDAGHALPYRDKPKAAAFRIVTREISIQETEKGAIYGDTMAQARARLEGKILSGTVSNITAVKAGRKTIHYFEVLTSQNNLRLRAGDNISLLTDPRLECHVENVWRINEITYVRLQIIKGMRAVGVPAEDSKIELADSPTSWYFLSLTRNKLTKRLATTPWTHDTDASIPEPQPASSAKRPDDLLTAIESLR